MSATSLAALTRTSDPQTVLRRLLALDAVVTGANGLAYLAVSGPLGRLLGIDRGLLLALGAFLFVYAAGVALLASRARPAAFPVRAVIEANLAWSVLSCVALATWLAPTTAGAVWTVLQALTVAAFAALQHVALKVRQGSSD
uniref:Integral membrane protein n=1 Tax=Streptomyces coeruleorubidus TaxID=116188 RepID=I3RN55_STRC4|nr:integral membrane protein [Streptomyces coeruleorubidus]